MNRQVDDPAKAQGVSSFLVETFGGRLAVGKMDILRYGEPVTACIFVQDPRQT